MVTSMANQTGEQHDDEWDRGYGMRNRSDRKDPIGGANQVNRDTARRDSVLPILAQASFDVGLGADLGETNDHLETAAALAGYPHAPGAPTTVGRIVDVATTEDEALARGLYADEYGSRNYQTRRGAPRTCTLAVIRFDDGTEWQIDASIRRVK